MCWTVQSLNPDRGRRFFSSPKRPNRLWSPPSLPLNGYRDSFPGAKRPRRSVKHSPPTGVEVKNEWLDLAQKKAAQLTNHTKYSDWKTLARRRTKARACVHFKACCGERAWKAIRDRLRRAYCLSMVDHVRKIRYRKQKTDIGKYFFVNYNLEPTI
jgi:hypothetical protein